MSKLLKKKWVTALTSGKFEQGTDYLKSQDYDYDNAIQISYCCLGVLNELCKTDTKMGGGDYELPTLTTLAKVGLNKRSAEELAGLNDAGAPFELIAGLINEAL